ncbi:putative cysteine hydrolase [Klebsiella michiganensis]|nr:putative cysteine hydrolase [Klebsiella michiganensis]
MSTPANFNGSRPVIDVNDTAMLLIDHQSGLFQTVGDMPDAGATGARRRAGEDGLVSRHSGDHHGIGAAGPERPADP